MKYQKLSLLILGIVLFSNCSKEGEPLIKPIEEPDPIVYFTFSIDQSINTSEEDNWVILHDENGTLLDYRPYESEETLEFEAKESEITNKINVSLFRKRQQTFATTDENCEGVYFSGITYPNIKIGSQWTQGIYRSRLDNPSIPENLGKFSLVLTDIPGQNNFLNDHFSGRFTGNVSTQITPEFGPSTSINPNGETKTITRGGLNNWNNTEYLMTLLNEDLDFKHLFFQNPEAATDVTLNYSDFISFDSYDNLPILPAHKSYHFTMVGFENETSLKTNFGFLILELWNANLGNNGIPLGYLDRFTHYKTFLNIDMADYNYRYSRLGPKHNISVIPKKPIISYTNNHLNSFDLSANVQYVRRTDAWRSSDLITKENCTFTDWRVECDQENYPNIGELPDELFNKYPELGKPNDLEYYKSTLYLQSQTYDEFIIKKFDLNSDPIISDGDTLEYIQMKKE